MQGFNKIEVYFSLTHWLEGSESKLKTTTEETGRQNKDSTFPRGIQFSPRQETIHMVP